MLMTFKGTRIKHDQADSLVAIGGFFYQKATQILHNYSGNMMIKSDIDIVAKSRSFSHLMTLWFIRTIVYHFSLIHSRTYELEWITLQAEVSDYMRAKSKNGIKKTSPQCRRNPLFRRIHRLSAFFSRKQPGQSQEMDKNIMENLPDPQEALSKALISDRFSHRAMDGCTAELVSSELASDFVCRCHAEDLLRWSLYRAKKVPSCMGGSIVMGVPP